MAYPPEVSKFLSAVRHAREGEFESSGVGANLGCGCFVRFAITVDTASGRVADAAFASNGCGYMVASAEIAAKAVENLNLMELRGDVGAVIESRLADVFAGVPDTRRACVAAVVKSAASAFQSRRARGAEEFRGETALICTCFGVTEDAIRTAITRLDLGSVRQVGDVTNAGTGCGSCQMLIGELLDEKGVDEAYGAT